MFTSASKSYNAGDASYIEYIQAILAGNANQGELPADCFKPEPVSRQY
jgi:hypothetical protein